MTAGPCSGNGRSAGRKQACRSDQSRGRFDAPQAAAGGVGVAAAAYAHYQKVSNLTTAHCYSLPQLGDNGTTIGVLSTTTGSSQVVDALGTCGMLWRDDFLSPGVSSIVRVTQTTTVHPVPNLVVCTMPDGTAGVFPGSAETCANLGLAEPDTSTTIQ